MSALRKPHHLRLYSLALALSTCITLPALAAGEYAKLNERGSQLSAAAASWACVSDQKSGLVWENKTNDSTLRDVNNTYSWMSKDSANKGRYDEKNGGSCTGDISCDSVGYVRALNRAKLCGFNNWRVPTRRELKALYEKGKKLPKIDQTFFPNTWESVYWASSGSTGRAQSVDFGDGFDYINRHSRAKYLRLVRSAK